MTTVNILSIIIFTESEDLFPFHRFDKNTKILSTITSTKVVIVMTIIVSVFMTTPLFGFSYAIPPFFYTLLMQGNYPEIQGNLDFKEQLHKIPVANFKTKVNYFYLATSLKWPTKP